MIVTGDTHGMIDAKKLDDYYDLIKKPLSGDTPGLPYDRQFPGYVLIAGDFGFIWKSNWYNPKGCKDKLPKIDDGELRKIKQIFDYYPWTTLWIDGNHENFDVLDKLPVEERWGGKVSVITDKCIRLHRGQVYTINGITFLAMGGAYSVDKYRRLKGSSWWPQETITEEDYMEAMRNLERVDFKVDFVVSHTCPSSAIKVLEKSLPPYAVDWWGPKQEDPSCDWLEKIWRSIDVKHWAFGHFHTDQNFKIGETKFHAKFDSFWDALYTKKKEEGLDVTDKLLLSLYDMEFT